MSSHPIVNRFTNEKIKILKINFDVLEYAVMIRSNV